MISIDDINDYDNKSNKRMFKRQSINKKRISFLETMNSSESIVSPIQNHFYQLRFQALVPKCLKLVQKCMKIQHYLTLLFK